MSSLCSACAVHFDDNFQRREHMREEWHVYNVKRRVSSLPPISSETYQAIFAHPARTNASSDSEPDPAPTVKVARKSPQPSIIDDVIVVPEQCVFCLDLSDSTTQNLEHMAASHGLVIPEIQGLQTDVETLISYLHLVVAEYCECLFCGASKRSAHAARAHMLAKGHCMLNLSAKSEFLDFWKSENNDEEEPAAAHRDYQLLSKTEMRLPSGAIATSRDNIQSGAQHRPRRLPRDTEPGWEIPTSPKSSDRLQDGTVERSAGSQDQPRSQKSCRALAMRDQMGITGLSEAQKRSLAVSQRKIDLSALRSRNKAQWTLEKMGNKVKQKHFFVGSPCRSGWFLNPVMR